MIVRVAIVVPGDTLNLMIKLSFSGIRPKKPVMGGPELMGKPVDFHGRMILYCGVG